MKEASEEGLGKGVHRTTENGIAHLKSQSGSLNVEGTYELEPSAEDGVRVLTLTMTGADNMGQTALKEAFRDMLFTASSFDVEKVRIESPEVFFQLQRAFSNEQSSIDFSSGRAMLEKKEAAVLDIEDLLNALEKDKPLPRAA